MKSKENKYVCDNCNNEYKTYQSLRNHKNKYHLKNDEVINKNIICKHCVQMLEKSKIFLAIAIE